MADASVEQPGMEFYAEGDDIGNTATRRHQTAKENNLEFRRYLQGWWNLYFMIVLLIHIKILSVGDKPS